MNTDYFNFAQIFPGAAMPDAPEQILGIEVTNPSLARRCGLGNIDPQHGTEAARAAPAAIEASLEVPLPPRGAWLVTQRPDLDALGAMAVLLIRAKGAETTRELHARLTRIAVRDRFERGPWPGRRPLPASIDELFAEGGSKDLAALSACAFDRTRTLSGRVGDIARWLLHGTVPAAYELPAYRRANDLLLSLALGRTQVASAAGGRLATVVSPHLGALGLGYRLAPVVVALNPGFQFPGGLGPKYTIAVWPGLEADLNRAAEMLNRREPGWGGQHAIKGSPQDRPSRLGLTEVVDCVAAVLPPLKEEGRPA